jgi:hypothetical protein
MRKLNHRLVPEVKLTLLAALALTGVSVVGCGKLNELESKLAASSTPTMLEGAWAVQCMPTQYGSYSKQASYTGNQFRTLERAFSDGHCQHEISRGENAGLFEIVGKLENHPTAMKINFHYAGSQQTVYDLFAIVNNNQMLMFGDTSGTLNTMNVDGSRVRTDGSSEALRPRSVGYPILTRSR